MIAAPVIVGIDPGTACGWAILRADGTRIASGVWDLKPRRHDGGGMRYLRVRDHMVEMLSQFQVERVAYEEVRRHVGTDAAHVYGGIVAMLAAVCEERGVPYVGAPVGTVKKNATGKGNADKALMISAALVTFAPHVVEDDNEADALFVALAAARRIL